MKVVAKNESVVYLQFNADDEIPNCICCDWQEECSGTFCGPTFFWDRYSRTITVPIEKYDG